MTSSEEATSSEQLFTLHHVQTGDDCKIALKYYAPAGGCVVKRFPVILCHGLACNHIAYELLKERSLAYTLRDQGYAVWLLDLRGSGNSGQKEGDQWGLMTYIEHDAKAAISYILAHHFADQADQVHWVGHSMGGILGYALLLRQDVAPKIRSVTSLASAVEYSDSAWRHFDFLYPLTSPFWPMVDVQGFCNLYSHIIPPFDEFLVQAENCRRENLQKVLQQGFSTVPMSLLADMRTALRGEGLLLSHDGQEIPIRSLLGNVERPVLVIGADKDMQCSEKAVRSTYEALGSKNKRCVMLGKDYGCKYSYGHLDILIGDQVTTEVFPHISTWLEEHELPCDGDIHYSMPIANFEEPK